MRKVWLTIPSARPVAEAAGCLLKWARAGYGIAVWRDQKDELFDALRDSGVPALILTPMPGTVYPGYANAVNTLCRRVLDQHEEARWCVAGGDDTDPDPRLHPNIIATQLEQYFNDLDDREGTNLGLTFGVMQPTGDRWADAMGPMIDRIAGSPWMGRAWCKRAFGGKGPLWPEFTHMFMDEHLQRAAQRARRFLQRPDLTHMHHHFTRRPIVAPGEEEVDWTQDMPEHCAKWNTRSHWNESKEIFQRLLAGGFAEALDVLQEGEEEHKQCPK